MSKNWAVVIGINGYNPLNFTPLKYAKHDAERVHEFFCSMQFEQVYLFTDDSESIEVGDISVPSDPTYGNLVTFLEDRFQPGVLDVGDNCWFFFAGHGEQHDGKDYLMPRDANSRGTKVISGLLVSEVREWLIRSGAGTVIMVLDACRSEGRRGGQFNPNSQQGVIIFSSCNPSEKSWEETALEQGVFTFAFLEALQLSGDQSCATVEQLGHYLKTRVPELCELHQKSPVQHPRVSVDPIEKQHFILLPQYARQADIEMMKAQGFQLAFEGQLLLAEQIFLRANVAARGLDNKIIDALTRIRMQMMESEAPIASLQNSPCEARDATPPLPISSVRSLASPKQQPSPSAPPAQWSEVLGNGVTLDLVQIPAGEFWMGQTDDEKRELIKQVGKDEYQGWYVNELPRHQVKLASFYMGKFPVTQAQYEGVMGHNPAAEYGERFTALDKPIINVSWEDAIAFCQKLSQQTGTQYRLASEAEWEYACRAGTTTAFYFGQSITTDQANYRGTDGEYDGKIHPGHYGNGPKGIFREEITSVDTFSANAFDLYDMHGNVLEWCQDCWHVNYSGAPTDGSAWETDGDQRIRLQRGGSWSYYPRTCRSANRVKSKVDNSNNFTGFRVVCSAPNALS